MSKSTQHFFLIEDVAKRVDPEVIRFYLQSTHYRSPIEWSEERLREAGIAYDRLREAIAKSESFARAEPGAPSVTAKESPLLAEMASLGREFEESLEDDFNTAKAQGHLYEMAKAINRTAEQANGSGAGRDAIAEAGQMLREYGEIIGLFWGAGRPEEEVSDEVQLLVKQRDEARLQKLWSRADELRDEILARGYVLEDSKEGTRARRKP